MSSATRPFDLVEAGTPLAEADAALVVLHGRGATAAGILPLGRELGRPGLAVLAPQAPRRSWYPLSFLAPQRDNEPDLTESLTMLDAVVQHARAAGAAMDRILLLGFSQGACLALEYAYRRPIPVGGVIGLTGGLIGPPGSLQPTTANLEGMPVLLASSDPDPHVPWSRVEETARLFELAGAAVDLRRYKGLGHTVTSEEIEAARRLLDGVLQTTGGSRAHGRRIG